MHWGLLERPIDATILLTPGQRSRGPVPPWGIQVPGCRNIVSAPLYVADIVRPQNEGHTRYIRISLFWVGNPSKIGEP